MIILSLTDDEFDYIVRKLVAAYTKVRPEDVYIVWRCKTLQNWKALAGEPVPDGMYFEITYNGNKDEVYFDAYRKVLNAPYDARTLLRKDEEAVD